MPAALPTLDTIGALDTAIAASAERPVLLFKHSLTCGTSAFAFEELETFAAEPDTGVDVFVIPVQTARAVSDRIAQQFGVRHESPQALLVRDGALVWHASHYRITAAALADACSKPR